VVELAGIAVTVLGLMVIIIIPNQENIRNANNSDSKFGRLERLASLEMKWVL